jgi:lipopolysaccharide biosynthesis glycosyltransferase
MPGLCDDNRGCPIAVVCAVDANYLRHCAALLHSLHENNADHGLAVYVIHGDLDPGEKARFIGFLSRFLPSVSLLQADPEVLDGFPVSGHITVSTYFRLLLPVLLPAGLQKVLFIDSDAIVTDSLMDLWQTPMEGKALAAVPEHIRSCADHGYVFGEYFNAGMMLVDLERWRQARLIELGRDFARANPHRLRHWDQDVLNHVFAGQWLPLGDRWNACPHLFGLNKDYDLSPELLSPAEQEAIDRPAIVHYAGPGAVKPWHHRCTHPWRESYRRHQAATPWASEPLMEQPLPWPIRAWQGVVFQAKCQVRSLLQGGS